MAISQYEPFWIELFKQSISMAFVQVPEHLRNGEPVTEMSFAGHYLHGKRQITPASMKFLNQLPNWTTSTSWSSTLDIYQL